MGELSQQSWGSCWVKYSSLVPCLSLVKILVHVWLLLYILKLNFLLFFFPIISLPQIMLLTDPEIESSLLISSDEGATYQKYRLNFYIQSLLFHPKQEDWILAYSQDQKVSMRALLKNNISWFSEGKTPSESFPRIRCMTVVICNSLNSLPRG